MIYYKNELYHHGILGQKWGVRRYQNLDGSLTAAGKRKYQKSDGSLTKKAKKHISENVWNGRLMDQNSNRSMLANKILSEIDSTEEAKAYNNLVRKRLMNDSNDSALSTNQIQMMKDMAVEKAYYDKDIEITNKYIRDWAGAILKDLGYDDTEKGRDFLISNGMISGI